MAAFTIRACLPLWWFSCPWHFGCWWARLWTKAVVVAVVALGFALHGILIAGMLLLVKGVMQDAGIGL
jgi:putative NADPH-quinone reductase